MADTFTRHIAIMPLSRVSHIALRFGPFEA